MKNLIDCLLAKNFVTTLEKSDDIARVYHTPASDLGLMSRSWWKSNFWFSPGAKGQRPCPPQRGLAVWLSNFAGLPCSCWVWFRGLWLLCETHGSVETERRVRRYLNPAFLNLQVAAPLGVKQPPNNSSHLRPSAHPTFTSQVITVSKLHLGSSNKNNFIVKGSSQHEKSY